MGSSGEIMLGMEGKGRFEEGRGGEAMEGDPLGCALSLLSFCLLGICVYAMGRIPIPIRWLVFRVR